MDKSGADVAIEGAILSEMLEIVAKRAALRPADANAYETPYTPVSLPILPPNTTQNPLQQYTTANNSNGGQVASIPSSTSSTLTNRYMKQHPYPGSGYNSRQRSQYKNEDVSEFSDEFSSVLSSTYSLMHDYYELMEKHKEQNPEFPHESVNDTINSCSICAQSVLVLFQFVLLYACILYYGFSRLEN